MSVTYPVPDLIDKALVKSCSFTLPMIEEIAGRGDGTIVSSELSSPLWMGEFTSVEMLHANAVQVQALINAIAHRRKSFYAWNPFAKAPQADPNGTILGASAVQIHTVDSGMILIRLKGLPAGYVITNGDLFHFPYGSPSSRALHQACETVTADGSGITPLFEIVPRLRTGATADQAVTLIKPSCEMRIRPGSVQMQNTNRMKTVISFQAGQLINA